MSEVITTHIPDPITGEYIQVQRRIYTEQEKQNMRNVRMSVAVRTSMFEETNRRTKKTVY